MIKAYLGLSRRARLALGTHLQHTCRSISIVSASTTTVLCATGISGLIGGSLGLYFDSKYEDVVLKTPPPPPPPTQHPEPVSHSSPPEKHEGAFEQ